MLFNSLPFVFFFITTFSLYWLAHRNRLIQNLLIIIASYIFYSWWEFKFVAILILSTLFNYFLGRKMGSSSQLIKQSLLGLGIFVNLAILSYFKYYGFFLENFEQALRSFNFQVEITSFRIIIPIGISFFTFQAMSYPIDIYREKTKPTKDIVSFAAFICFFPQLLAGPIEKANRFLPQFLAPRTFNHKASVDGLRQILWGAFKKLVIADNCGILVDQIFDQSGQLHGSTLALGLLLFSFQIYGDFSGYSDMAIGMAKIFGFQLSKNFSYPYFSSNIAEFWRKWHISLTSWFKDYLYIPLGGSRVSKFFTLRNVLIVFLVSGFWHGANWTFIVWGGYHALLFISLLLIRRNRSYKGTSIVQNSTSTQIVGLKIIGTFCLISLGWIFFRAQDLAQAQLIISKIFSASLFQPIEVVTPLPFIFVAILIVVEWSNKSYPHVLSNLNERCSAFWRWSIYLVLGFTILLFKGDQKPFIYFDF